MEEIGICVSGVFVTICGCGITFYVHFAISETLHHMLFFRTNFIAKDENIFVTLRVISLYISRLKPQMDSLINFFRTIILSNQFRTKV